MNIERNIEWQNSNVVSETEKLEKLHKSQTIKYTSNQLMLTLIDWTLSCCVFYWTCSTNVRPVSLCDANDKLYWIQTIQLNCMLRGLSRIIIEFWVKIEHVFIISWTSGITIITRSKIRAITKSQKYRREKHE